MQIQKRHYSLLQSCESFLQITTCKHKDTYKNSTCHKENEKKGELFGALLLLSTSNLPELAILIVSYAILMRVQRTTPIFGEILHILYNFILLIKFCPYKFS